MRVIRHPDELAATAAAADPVRAALSSAADDSVILVGSCADGTAIAPTRWLCIRTMRRGFEHCRLGRRRIAVDEDAYLVVNAGSDCRGVYHGDAPVSPVLVCFAPDVCAEALRGDPAQGPHSGCAAATGFGFTESLRPASDRLGRSLGRMARAVDAGQRDSLWYDEQALVLLGLALASEPALRGAAGRIDCVKPSTREELFRRVLLEGDFIQTHYEQPISLGEMAAAARLSRFHLVRLFRQALGITPHAYLRDKRIAVARRLIARSACDLSEIAARSGFGSRSSLFRNLQRQHGVGGKALRARDGAAPQPPHLLPRGREACAIRA